MLARDRSVLLRQTEQLAYAIVERRDVARDVPRPCAELRRVDGETIAGFARGDAAQRGMSSRDILHERPRREHALGVSARRGALDSRVSRGLVLVGPSMREVANARKM